MYCLTGLNSALLVVALMITLHPELVLTETPTACDIYFHPQIDRTVDATSCTDKNKVKSRCRLSTCQINSAPWDQFSFKNCTPYKTNPPNSSDLDTSQSPKAVQPLMYLVNTVNGYLNVQGTDKKMYRCPIGSSTDPKLNTQRASCSSCGTF